MRSIKTTIIGGGLLGLSIAYFLRKKGYENILIIEKEKKLGGICSWLEIEETLVGRFYHVIMAEDERIFRFMDELGLKESYGYAQTSMGVFNGSDSHPISTLRNFLTYPDLSLRDKFHLGYSLLYCQFYKDWKKFENFSAPEKLIQLSGKKIYELLWQPIIRAKFGDKIDQLTFVDMWSRIVRLSRSRKINFSQAMGYIKGTAKTLIDRLEQVLTNDGVIIINGNGVKKIITDKQRIKTVFLQDGTAIESAQYIFTGPIPELEKLIPEEYSDYKNKLKQIQYLDNVCLILKLTKPLTPYYMLNLRDTQTPFTGVIGLTNVYPKEGFDGYSIFYISKYMLGQNEFFDKNKQELLSIYLPYLKKINPEFNETWIAGYEISKGKNIEPFRRINYSKYIPEVKTIFDNCFLVTSAQIYPAITVLNSSVIHAEEFVRKFVNYE